jgi:hypothetical protein
MTHRWLIEIGKPVNRLKYMKSIDNYYERDSLRIHLALRFLKAVTN